MSQGYNPQGGQGFNPQGFDPQPYPNIQSPIVWSILSTFCCCLPFGIVSIVYAAKVNSLAAVGAFQEAKESADKAKMWAWIAFGLGLVFYAIEIAIKVLTAIASEGGGY